LFLDVGLKLILQTRYSATYGLSDLSYDLLDESPFYYVFRRLVWEWRDSLPIAFLFWIPCLLEMVLPMAFFLLSRRGFKKRQIWLLAVPGAFIVLRSYPYISSLSSSRLSLLDCIYYLPAIISSCITVVALT